METPPATSIRLSCDEAVGAHPPQRFRSVMYWYRDVFTYILARHRSRHPRGPTTTRAALPATGSSRGTFCCRRTSHVRTALQGLPLNAEVGGGGVTTKRLHPLTRHFVAEADVERREPSEDAHRPQPVVRQQLPSFFLATLTTAGKRRTSSHMPSSVVFPDTVSRVTSAS